MSEVIEIEGVKYIREDVLKDFEDVLKKLELLSQEGDILEELKNLKKIVSNGTHSAFLGQYVIHRTDGEGINAGILKAADETGVVLADSRRLWYHEPSDASTSWFEGVAVSGLSENSKISGKTPAKAIISPEYSLTLCTKTARDSIEAKPTNAQKD